MDNLSKRLFVLILANQHNLAKNLQRKKNNQENISEIYGLAQGKGNLRIDLNLVPQEKDIAKEDLVFTTVLAGVFPRGLLVGEIKEVKNSDISNFQEAEIERYFKNNLLGTLFVIKNFIPKEEL